MSERGSNAPHPDDEFAYRLADKLFPAWAEMKRLVSQIEELERVRVRLLESEPPAIEEASDEIYHEKKRAEDLIQMIEVFECGQNIRVQKIEQKILDAEALIDDTKERELQAKNQMLVEVLRCGKMLPAVSSKLNWEVDTDDGDEPSQPDGFRSATETAEKNIRDLREDLNVEATMNGFLQHSMLDFAINADLTEKELCEWLCGEGEKWGNPTACTDFRQKLRLMRSTLQIAEERTGKYMRQKFDVAMAKVQKDIKAAEEKKEDDKEASETASSVSFKLSATFSEPASEEEAASAPSPVIDNVVTATEVPVGNQPPAWNSIDTRYCFTCKQYGHTDKHCYVLDFPTDQAIGGNPDTASDDGSIIVNTWQTATVKQPNFCYSCDKWGHTDEFCKVVFPEEEIANFCEVCDREGHTEENCFRLHPHLKAEHDAKQKKLKEKMLCTGCGKMGHMRRWCYKLHPELKPQQYHV